MHTVLAETWLDGEWTALSVHAAVDVVITRGRPNQTSDPVPGTATFTLIDPVDPTAPTYDPTDPRSVLYGQLRRYLPLRVTINGDRRFTGEISELTPHTGLSGIRTTAVVASGILRRLAQGDPAVRSPLTGGYLGRTDIREHWPLEDGVNTTAAGSSIAGRFPALVSGDVTFGVDPGILVGARSVVRLGSTGRLSARAQAQINTTTGYRLHVSLRLGGTPTGSAEILRIGGSAGLPLTTVTVISTGWEWRVYNASGVAVIEEGINYGSLAAPGNWITLSLDWRQNGAQTRFWPRWHPIGTNTFYALGSGEGDAYTVNATLGQVTGVDLVGSANVPDGIEFGQAALLETYAGGFNFVPNLALGYTGELASVRLTRLAEEVGVPVTIVGADDDTQPMGPQPITTFKDSYLQIERTDQGLLIEDRDAAELTYLAGHERLNRGPVLTLDWTGGQVAEPFAPTVDDDGIFNQVTVKKATGGEVTVSRTVGPLNTAAPTVDPDGIGVVSTSIDANPALDADLTRVAGWALHQSTIDEPRFESITVDLDAPDIDPGTADDAAAVDVADLVDVFGLPYPVRQEVLATTEVVSGYGARRRITFTTRTASGWSTPWVDGGTIIGHDAATVDADFTAGTDTALTVATGGGRALWATGATDMDVIAAGVRLHVTAITGGSSPQTFTVDQQPVNDVAKVIPAGTVVRVADRTYYGIR